MGANLAEQLIDELRLASDEDRKEVLDHFCKDCGCHLPDGGGWCTDHEPDLYEHMHGEDL